MNMWKFKCGVAAATVAMALSSQGAVVTVTNCVELLAAAAAAKSLDEIVMASPDGTYPVTYNMTTSVTINVKAKLRGATGNRDDVILDFSNMSGYGVYIKGTYDSLANSATAHSFTIQNATNMSATATIGGGLSLDEGFVSNVVVRNCYAGSTTDTPFGGGINMSGRFGITMSVISNCAAVSTITSAAGGGVWTRNSGVLNNTLITNCYVSAGSAKNAYGGGIGTAAAYTFQNCQIVFNRILQGSAGSSLGGGVYAAAAPSTITNCSFAGNTSIGSGGAFWTGYSTKPNILVNSTFEDNACTNSGGAAYFEYADVLNCKFLRNRTGSTDSGLGGAVNIINGGTVKGSFFKDNAAGRGGACYGAITNLSNNVFENNSAA